MSGANFVFLGGRFQAPFSLEYGRYAPVARLMLLLWLPPFIHIYIYKYIYIYHISHLQVANCNGCPGSPLSTMCVECFSKWSS